MSEDSHIAVIGLGYVGLPLAIAFAEAGVDVTGVDASEQRVGQLLRRSSPIDDITDERLSAALDGRSARRRRRTTPRSTTRTPSSCASRRRSRGPRTRTSGPSWRRRRSSATTSARGQLIVLQSTTFPGTTTGPFRELLEESA